MSLIELAGWSVKREQCANGLWALMGYGPLTNDGYCDLVSMVAASEGEVIEKWNRLTVVLKTF